MPTAYKGTTAEVRALDCYIKLMRASDTVAARIREQVAAFGLTESQFAVLEAVYHAGSLRATEIARKVLRSGANVTTVLDNLEKQGVLRRCECPNDRRAIHVKLTPEGEELMRRVFPAVAGRITGLMASLEPAQQEEMARLAKKLGLGARE